jgi:hypothetical protein
VGAGVGLVVTLLSAVFSDSRAIAAEAGARSAPAVSPGAPLGASSELPLPPLTQPTRHGSGAFRPFGAMELGVGILILPDAEVCAANRCERGDVSLAVDARPLYRFSRSWAFGAGLMLALTPTTPPQRQTLFPRRQARRYFLVEGVARYYVLRDESLQAWLGLASGLVAVSDNFRTPGAAAEFSVIGSSSANLVTEGFSAGIDMGAAFPTAQAVVLGAALRVGTWVLPVRSLHTPLGDDTSLRGRNTTVGFVFSAGFGSDARRHTSE